MTIKRIGEWAVCICLLLISVACEKAPLDNKIEGFWQMETITTLKDGKTTQCSRMYYAITRYVVELSERQGDKGYPALIGRFAYTDDSHSTVIMKEFKHRASTADNKEPATLEELNYYGIDKDETRFEVVKADGKTLILRSDYAEIKLKRF